MGSKVANKYLLLGRALDRPVPTNPLLVSPSKLDCLMLAKFFRLELKDFKFRQDFLSLSC